MVIGRMSKESLARVLVFGLVFGVGIFALAFRLWNPSDVIEIHAAMPEKGGWLPDNIEAKIREPLDLRLVSDDVVHSFAIGQSDFEPVDVLPGVPTDITLTFDEPGTYTFFCTRWCGADHWRMRGTITVVGEGSVVAENPNEPLYMQLGIDIDAVHDELDIAFDRQPSALRGAVMRARLPSNFQTQDYYRSHSPYQVWQEMQGLSSYDDLSDSQVWDLVAWVWSQNTSPAQIAGGEALYQRDCAACHGVDGDGSGVFATEGSSEESTQHENGFDGHSIEAPTNFQDTAHMLTASPARLQGKIIRGGMGTGMPSWGLIYTEEQTWNLADYLWTFQFKYDRESHE